METIVGFVIGFVVGTREGRAGLQRLRASWAAIRTSPEAHRLVREATAVAEGVAKQATRRGLAGTLGEVAEMLARRAAGRDGAHQTRHAA